MLPVRLTPLAATNLFLVVEVHFTVGHLPPQPVHVLAELQTVFSLVGGLIQLLGQVEVLAVQLGVLLRQRGQLLLQICDDLQGGGESTGHSDGKESTQTTHAGPKIYQPRLSPHRAFTAVCILPLDHATTRPDTPHSLNSAAALLHDADI